ncbi:MAG: hypothetical protein AAGJ37_17510 [Pseudomonadota bacterium]
MSPFYSVIGDLIVKSQFSSIKVGSCPDREMDIPRFKLPFVLNAWTWVYLNRFLWMLGKRGAFESYKEARARSALAASELMNIAKNERDIIVFSHGYLILHMRKHLRDLGFKQLSSSNDYWGVSVFEV